jgi:5-methylcytosine-specific restriction endonuclease McrA
MVKHRRTKATDISPAVKKKVEKRDSYEGCPCCIWCGKPHSRGEAHYISRAQGGLGIEENLLTLCPDCHRLYDGKMRKEMRPLFKIYLKSKYPGWDESKLIYRKWER